MPLIPSILAQAITQITDGSRYPGSSSEAVDRWAAAIRTYFTPLVAPLVLPGAHLVSEAACRGVLGGMLLVDAVEALKRGVAAYAGVLAGMPVVPGVAIPPVGMPVIPSIAPTMDAASAASIVAGAVQSWVVTGQWIVAPMAPPVPWS